MIPDVFVWFKYATLLTVHVMPVSVMVGKTSKLMYICEQCRFNIFNKICFAKALWGTLHISDLRCTLHFGCIALEFKMTLDCFKENSTGHFLITKNTSAVLPCSYAVCYIWAYKADGHLPVLLEKGNYFNSYWKVLWHTSLMTRTLLESFLEG